MKSRTPKVLHAIAGRSMVEHVLSAVSEAGASEIAAVVGPHREDVASSIRRVLPKARIFVQTERLGTAHAVLSARTALRTSAEDVVIAFADTPLITPETFARLRAPLGSGAAVAVLGFEAADPTGYGRLITDEGRLIAIREHRDASAAEKQITFCNAGLMAFRGDVALDLLERIGNQNAKGEYYLTDAVEIAHQSGLSVVAVTAPEAEVQGVNDRVQLATAERTMQDRLRRRAMEAGATLVAPETVFFSYDTRLGRDVVIEPNVVFGPGVAIEDDVVIHAFSHVEGARVASGASVGPYARLRPGATLGAHTRVGNFVEIKNADLGAGSKVNHLSYVGDATVGPNVNIGAGTITCNYDGFRKHRTVVEEGAFVGSNSALVAPVTIGKGAYVGSGSVITQDVPPDALAIGRGRQSTRDDWARAYRERAKAEKPK
jgi:bifunctional UDP-N-acetylglucosamine pyrophosphorylase / glucosamine-1-phosphate N-acetyltransferase